MCVARILWDKSLLPQFPGREGSHKELVFRSSNRLMMRGTKQKESRHEVFPCSVFGADKTKERKREEE